MWVLEENMHCSSAGSSSRFFKADRACPICCHGRLRCCFNPLKLPTILISSFFEISNGDSFFPICCEFDPSVDLKIYIMQHKQNRGWTYRANISVQKIISLVLIMGHQNPSTYLPLLPAVQSGFDLPAVRRTPTIVRHVTDQRISKPGRMRPPEACSAGGKLCAYTLDDFARHREQ